MTMAMGVIALSWEEAELLGEIICKYIHRPIWNEIRFPPHLHRSGCGLHKELQLPCYTWCQRRAARPQLCQALAATGAGQLSPSSRAVSPGCRADFSHSHVPGQAAGIQPGSALHPLLRASFAAAPALAPIPQLRLPADGRVHPQLHVLAEHPPTAKHPAPRGPCQVHGSHSTQP